MLTAGGDCPGLNAAIRAVVTRLAAESRTVVGIRAGWAGLMNDDVTAIGRDDVRGILWKGGTILGTSRLDPYVHGDGVISVRETMDRHGIGSLIVIGGDGSLRTASKLASEGIPVVGVPKTIDNDIAGTDVSIGFTTAVQIVVDAIDRLTTTAEAHNRVMVVEVMGRTTGWIAAHAAIAGGAEAVLVPEQPYDLPDLGLAITRRHERFANYSVIVVAEGIDTPVGTTVRKGRDMYGFERLGGVGNFVASAIENLTGFETRVTTLGYLQRGGTPTAFDRVLATRLGVRAAEMAIDGVTRKMVALKGRKIVGTDLKAACANPRSVDPSLLRDVSWFLPLADIES